MCVITRKIGFTGTRKGMTAEQKRSFIEIWNNAEIGYFEFHHGCCIGADTDAHTIVNGLADQRDIVIHQHPPTDQRKAIVHEGYGILTGAAKPFIDRNHDIVDATDILIATPEGVEVLRSGTWATVRYARRLKKPVVIIYPSGKIVVENGKAI